MDMNFGGVNIKDLLGLLQGLRNSGTAARYAGESSVQAPQLASQKELLGMNLGFGREQLGEQGRQFNVTSELQKRLAEEEIRNKRGQQQRADNWMRTRQAYMNSPWHDEYLDWFKQPAPTGY